MEKLSELSKPVAEIKCHEDLSLSVVNVRDGFSLGRHPLYSQEYVSALLARIAELEAKLATPVRLPRPACTYADHSYPAYSQKQVEEIITSVGMRFTVEGDE